MKGWRWKLLIGMVLLPSLVLSAEPKPQPGPAPPAKLEIVPDEDSVNPVKAGQSVSLGLVGLDDPSKGEASVWPPATLTPVLVGRQAEDGWIRWGTVPKLQFFTQAVGKYRVQVQVEAAGRDPRAEYVIEVEGPLPPPVFDVVPVGPFTSSGPVGGPFEPRVQDFTVASSEEWTAVPTEDCKKWVVVNPQEGAEASGVVSVFIGAGAAVLPEGTHTGTVTFTSGPTAIDRQVVLTVTGDDPPPPPPPPGKMWVLIVKEQDHLDEYPEGQPAVFTSPAIRDYLNAKCDKEELPDGTKHPAWRNFDDDAKPSEMPSSWTEVFDYAVKARRESEPIKTLPNGEKVYPIWMLIAKGEQYVFDGPMPESIDAVMTELKKHGE